MILFDMTQRSIQSTGNSIQSANSQSANSYDANCRHLSMSMCMPQMTAEQVEAQIVSDKTRLPSARFIVLLRCESKCIV